jgi:hypothetical protein
MFKERRLLLARFISSLLVRSGWAGSLADRLAADEKG